MLLGVGGLVAAYVAVALLLLALMLYSNWPWAIKAVTIAIVSGFYVVSYFSFGPLQGWPVAAQLPHRFNLIAVSVTEPDKITDSTGEIYLWVTNMDDSSPAPKPRAYRLSFTPQLHAAVVEANEKLQKNMPQLGEVDAEQNDGAPQPGSRLGQESVNIKFYDLPDPIYPEK